MTPRGAQRAGREIARALAACALLTGIYYLVPVEPGIDAFWRVVRSALSVLAILVLAVLISRSVVRLLRNAAGSRPANLLVALWAGVVLFAFLDFQLAVGMPGQFTRLDTKTDALYFAVSTLTTVGYGDVHASGQWGRGLVILQQLFNVGVLATAGAVLLDRLTSGHPPPPPPPNSPTPPQPNR
ncbi:two pore domain potassium channel family protein [Natronosporangium hydrolyticum]|uniref:Two pore domain potassium channel family protein n=1 Tax=Natronosporangium hydrolyticum TaxID=2811111 RepID=A0A895YBN9_9ACTN|nr:potassium channel family protein [Natronosporangium hydrolyticum]QSB12739.1 two pore domain potassium channel family protein [Natronosporangium hydrolyticum]